MPPTLEWKEDGDPRIASQDFYLRADGHWVALVYRMSGEWVSMTGMHRAGLGGRATRRFQTREGAQAWAEAWARKWWVEIRAEIDGSSKATPPCSPGPTSEPS